MIIALIVCLTVILMTERSHQHEQAKFKQDRSRVLTEELERKLKDMDVLKKNMEYLCLKHGISKPQ